jgi:indole-3-glycerol phosphate synthase
MNFLSTIIDQKKKEISELKVDIINENFIEYSLIEKLHNSKLHLIAEVKKASPSKGLIYSSFNPSSLAQTFEKKGASCISVLTDKMFFKGGVSDLISVKKSVSLPVLRKDFIIDPIQVTQSKSIGADVILLILDILSIQQANELIEYASELCLEVLLEVHSINTLEKLSDVTQKPMVGINNRNLETFECNINHAIEFKKQILSMDPSIKIIAESGYFYEADLDTLVKNNINGVLIGEGLQKNKQLLEWFNEG